MPLFRAFCVAGLLLAAWLPATASPGQDVPPLATPDVTTLLAPPPGSGASDVTTPSNDGGADSGNAGDAGANGSADDSDNTPPPPCGTQPISIASLGWPSAQLLAAIHARVLKAQFGCTVQVLPGDMGSVLSGMASTGQPAVAPEMWIDRIADQWNAAAKDQKLRQVGLTYPESQFEGWYVPDYVMAAHPELKSATALKNDAAALADGGAKPKFISCPVDWACSVINRNLIRAEGLEGLFDIVEPKNRYDLDQTIAAAVSRKQPIVFYYWQPNAALSQFAFKQVDLGAYSRDDFTCLGKRSCADPKPSAFAPEPVVIALAQWVFTGAPDIAAYFQRAEMPMDAMDAMLAALNVPGATVDSVADKFVADHADIWQKWVDLPAATPASDAGSTDNSSPSEASPPPAAPSPPVAKPRFAPPEAVPTPQMQRSLPPPSLTQ